MRYPSTELILSRPVVAVDTETTGLQWWKDRVFAVSLAWRNDDRSIGSWYGDLRDEGVIRWLRDVLPGIRLAVGHNFKFDVHMLRERKMRPAHNRIACTMIREALIDENKYEYGLDSLGTKYLQAKKVDIWPALAAQFGGKPTKEAQAPNLMKAPRSLVEPYALFDAELALQIFEKQQEIIDREDLNRVDEMERELLECVIYMEHGGVRVDLGRAEEAANFLDKEARRAQTELNKIAGTEFNANSVPQCQKLMGVHKDEDGFFKTADGVILEPTESGKSGSLKTDRLYRSTLPQGRLIADLRGFIKARDVFLRKYCLEMSHQGYIHATINQTRTEDGDGTYTGRLSITEPALQQIHKRNKTLAAIVRSVFVPDEDCEWACWDWSQMDFRVMAHYANDQQIVAAYASDPRTDFHTLVSKITGLPRDRDQKTGGANAKQMNLGLAFNMGAGRMAKEMNLPYTVDEKKDSDGNVIARYLHAGPEAMEYFNKYHHTIPGPSRLKQEVEAVAKSRGYIRTQLGRRIRFPGGRGSFKASGLLYQGMAAEALKVKMVELYRLFRGSDQGRYMVTVHDEHDASLRMGRRPEFVNEVTNILQRFDGTVTPIHFRVPVMADFGIGPNWWEASK